MLYTIYNLLLTTYMLPVCIEPGHKCSNEGF